MKDNPTPDLSEVLIKEFSAHKIKNTEPTEELINGFWTDQKKSKIECMIYLLYLT